MRLAYSARSLCHLQAIHDYIAKDNPTAADKTVERIRLLTSRLATFPHAGRPGPHGTRILSVPGTPYVVIYRLRDDVVSILTIFHTSRNRRFR